MQGTTTQLSGSVFDAMAQAVAAELSRVARLVPASPAAELGRSAQPFPDRWSGVPRPLNRQLAPQPHYGSAAKAAFAELPQLVAERLLGALELSVAALDLPVPELVEALPEAPRGSRGAIVTVSRGHSEMSGELSKLDAIVPGATDMVAYVVATLAPHPLIAPLLVTTGTDEAAIAASHGALHLALAVLVAAIVLRALWPQVTVEAIVGAALGVTARFLREAPMPAAYAEARLARRRAEYLMPRHGRARATVAEHVFTLAEGPLETAADFSDNGLVAVLPQGIAICSGQETASVSVSLMVVEEPPTQNLSIWDEVVEVSWHAPNGGASFAGNGDAALITPPWPGDYRVRVSARGRDAEQEAYEVAVWRAPAAKPVVHKHSDRLGYVLRGEPVPPVAVVPDEVYHWVENSGLSQAATVTFVSGKSSSEVLRGFGAEESEPTPMSEFFERDYQNADPWVCVLDVPGGAVAVEFDSWEGSKGSVLRALSAPDTTAASMFWNVNALCRFSLARTGDVLTQFELGLEETTSAEALELLADLEVEGRHRNAVGLLAATRFTGVSLCAKDLARIEAVGIGYPILPLLPELYVEQRLDDGSRALPGHGPLGADTDRLAALPDADLRDLAWWVADFAAAHSELSEHPAITASLAARALTPEAEVLARRSQLHEHTKHQWTWMTLHAATNPDPLGAAIGTLDKARNAVAGHAADLLDQARARVGR